MNVKPILETYGRFFVGISALSYLGNVIEEPTDTLHNIALKIGGLVFLAWICLPIMETVVAWNEKKVKG